MRWKALWPVVFVLMAMGTSPALAAPVCPFTSAAHAEAKPNKLYLFFPDETLPSTTDPAVFPLHGFDLATDWLPLPKFDTSGFRAYGGTSAQLRDAIQDVVTDIYCEFNVQVIATPRPPAPTAPRRNVVGIGVDASPNSDCNAFLNGEANTAGGDPGDSKPIDFARVWAGFFNNCSTVDLGLTGWANSIGGTVAHEAAHNYGLSHADGFLSRSGEDDLMKDGNSYSALTRSKRRQFSDVETSLMARHVGLAMDSMWTWGFTNHNGTTARKLRMEVLSIQTDLILSWTLAGPTSPWVNPVLSGPSSDTQTIGDTIYHKYQIEWSIPNEHWTGQIRDGVRPREGFQVGVTFSSVSKDRRVCGQDECRNPDSVVIAGVTLFNNENRPLSDHPHWLGFDAGTFDGMGNLNLRFINFLNQPLTLRDVKVQDLPRVMSISAMNPDSTELRDVLGRSFNPWPGGIRCPLSTPATPAGAACLAAEVKIEAKKDLLVSVARRSQARHVSVQRTEDECPRGLGGHGGLRCHAGITADDLFPATTMYVTATVVDSAGRESHLFYQIAGRRARACIEADPCEVPIP